MARTSTKIYDEDPVRQLLMINFFNDLNDFMSQRHGYKRHKCNPWVSKVDARCSKFSLTLSFRFNNSVGISAISFKEKRRGHCTALIEFLDSVSFTYCIPYIEFVNVMTESMGQFVTKNKFINRVGYYSIFDEGEAPSADWYRYTPFGLKEK